MFVHQINICADVFTHEKIQQQQKRKKTYAHRKSLPPPPSLIVCPLDDHLQIRIAFRDEMAE